MKIRIQGNSIRYRLSKSDVSKLASTGQVTEQIAFPQGTLHYTLQRQPAIEKPYASFENQSITIYIPEHFAKSWPDNNVVGTEANMSFGAAQTLFILIEKDFKCTDNTAEDQSDNYDHPQLNC